MFHSIKYGNFNLPDKTETPAQMLANPRYRAAITFLNSAGAALQKDETIFKTPFVWNNFSPFPSDKFLEDKKRDFMRINFDLTLDSHNEEIMNYLLQFEKAYEEQKKDIFMNRKKLYTNYTMKIVKTPQKKENLMADDDDETETKTEENTKPLYSKISLEKVFNMYYDNEKLDDTNKRIINKKLFDGPKRKGDAFKAHKASLSFKLHVPNGASETLEVLMTEIEERRDFEITIAYREIAEDYKNYKNLKHPQDCTASELNEIYGKPKKVILQNIKDIEKYCRGFSYYSYKIISKEISANKEQSKMGDPWVVKPDLTCISMSIIHFSGNAESNKSHNPADDYFNDDEDLNVKPSATEITDRLNNLSIETKAPVKEIKESEKEEIKKSSSDEDEEEDDDDDDDEDDEDDDEEEESSEEPVIVVPPKKPATVKVNKK